MKRIAIIGGGISGLSAAVKLERARQAGAALEYVLFERETRLGGVMVTDYIDGCIVEAGPDSFLSEKHWGLDFCRSLGLGGELIGSNDAGRKTYILVNGRLVALPDGLMFMVPTKSLPILTTPLFSLTTKLRMAREFFRRRNSYDAHGDETVAQLIDRHYGREMVERLADPLLAGVYGGDAASLSASAVLPRFVQMERKYGSLSRGMLAARKRIAAASAKPGTIPTEGSRPRPLFTSLKNGMQQLVDTIEGIVPPEFVRTGVEASVRRGAGSAWSVRANGQAESFDATILATPAPVAGRMLWDIHNDLATDLQHVEYSSSVTVTLGYNRDDLAHLPAGFGFLVPRSEGKRMLACTFVHNKFPHRAPADKGILRVFLGGCRDERVLALSDEDVLAAVRRELKEIAHLDAEPRWRRVYRWNKAMAQYGPGHLARVERINKAVEQVPGLALAGNAYQGIGVPDCIVSGLAAVERILAQLGFASRETRARTEMPACVDLAPQDF